MVFETFCSGIVHIQQHVYSVAGIFQKSLIELFFAKIYLRSVAYNKLKYPYNPESQKKKKNLSWEFWVIFSCDHYLSPSTEEFCLFQSVCDPSRAWRRRTNSFPNFGGIYLVRIFYYVSVSISLRVGLAHTRGDGGREKPYSLGCSETEHSMLLASFEGFCLGKRRACLTLLY